MKITKKTEWTANNIPLLLRFEKLFEDAIADGIATDRVKKSLEDCKKQLSRLGRTPPSPARKKKKDI